MVDLKKIEEACVGYLEQLKWLTVDGEDGQVMSGAIRKLREAVGCED